MGRRSNGDGYFRKLPNGKWMGQIMVGFKENGKKNVKTFTAATKGEVQEMVRKYLSQKAAGLLLNETMLFATWADRWYRDYKSQVQPSTHSGYQYTLNTLKAHFGEQPLGQIKTIHINEFMDELAESGCSDSKLSKCRAMLIQILDAAEANELVTRNAARRAKLIRDLSGQASAKDAFTETEVTILLELLPDDLLGHSIRVLLGSGLRVQELLALTPNDIAEDGSWIKVSKAIQMVDGLPQLGPPKSKLGNRTVPIPKRFRESARYLRNHGGKAFIWCSGRKSMLYSVGTFRRRYNKAIGQIDGVRSLTPHCCRHTYVTMLEKRGVPLVEIARLVGHSRVSTTDGYLHLASSTLEEAVSTLNN